MKILSIAPTPFFSDRGTHIRILEEALALEKLGHKVIIATYHIGKTPEKEIKTNIETRRILRLLFWYKKLEAGPDWQKIILDLMLIRKVFFLARTEKPEIIHGHLHEGVLIGSIVKTLLFWRRIKLVADFHGSLTKEMVSHGYLKIGLKKIFSALEKKINSLGDFAVTSSWELTEDIRKDRKDKKVETILDGTNLKSFSIEKSQSEIRKEMELPQDKTIIVYSGSLVPNKGIDYLFESIKISLEKRSDIFFLLGGFPVEHAKKFVKENNISKESLRIVSPLDYFSLPEFLLSADIAIDPKDSGTKQASGKMLNYMSAGLPVICFDKTNNHEYLKEGGVFSSEISGQGLAEKIMELVNNRDSQKQKGEYNRKRAKNFSWENSGKKLVSIYNQLIK